MANAQLASDPPPPPPPPLLPVELFPLLVTFTLEDDDEEGPNDVGGLLLKLVLGMAAGFDELELLVLLLQLDEGAFVAGAAIFCPFGSHGTAANIANKQKYATMINHSCKINNLNKSTLNVGLNRVCIAISVKLWVE